MELRKTLTLSVFLHAGIFTAALVLSAHLYGGGSRIHDDSVFFIKLTEDTGRPGIAGSAVKAEGQHTDNPGQTGKEIEKEKKNELNEGKESVKYILPSNDKPAGKEADVNKEDTAVNEFVLGEEKDPAVDIWNQAVSPESFAAGGKDRELNTGGSANNHLMPGHDNSETSGINVSSLSLTPAGDEGQSRVNGGVLSPGLIETIRRSIERAKKYPVSARKRGIEGIVYIGFRISPQGKPHDIKILKSSGYRILDKTTLDIVKKAAPFPNVDSPVEVPVVFRLKN